MKYKEFPEDFYLNDIHKASDLKIFEDLLEERKNEAYLLTKQFADQAISYLKYGNSGGIAVILSFLGASNWDSH